MSARSYKSARNSSLWNVIDPSRISEDRKFDQIFPKPIQRLSPRHWSPVNVCRLAAELLVETSSTRVLDIGCGPGKFCIVGASATNGHFTGVEQRKRLVRIAQRAVKSNNIPRVEIIHGNMTEIDLQLFDAFYIFNPFIENIHYGLRIDHGVELEPSLYFSYISHLRQQFKKMPVATRIVTYCGDCAEIPDCYERVGTTFGGELNFWVKQEPGASCPSAAEFHWAKRHGLLPPESDALTFGEDLNAFLGDVL